MSAFTYRESQFYVEDIALSEIAQRFGTPCYVYSIQTLRSNWLAYAEAFQHSGYPHQIFYAVKANSNLSLLNILYRLGASFDAVSGGEIERVLAAGCTADRIMFSGVGKSVSEITRAIELGIHSINIESAAELLRVHEIAKQLNKTANIAFRINPNVKVDSHPYISTGSHCNKFGIDHNAAIAIYKQAAELSYLKICGISCHIGSQILSIEPFVEALEAVLKIVDQLKNCGITLEFIDIGGGLGIKYSDEHPPTPVEYVDALVTKMQGRTESLHIEPGRSIVADSGVLLTKIEYIKTTGAHNFAVVDAAMNDLMRPALYESYHQIVPVQILSNTETKSYAVVGPVCESGDFFGTERELAISAGDLLAIKDCGAYGSSMSSNYNTRPRVAEILVSGSECYEIRKRETITELLQNEINNYERLILD